MRDLVKLLERDGWYHDSQRGSHRHYKHPVKPGKATIAGHLNDEVPPKTLGSILKQAGLK